MNPLLRFFGAALAILPFIVCPACHYEGVMTALGNNATPAPSVSPDATATVPDASPSPDASPAPEASPAAVASPDATVATPDAAAATPEAPVATPEASPEPDATPEAPAATPEPEVKKVQGELNKGLEVKNIEFETSKARLTRRGRRTLDYVASELKKAPEAPVDIIGHTDSRGDDTMNQQLSDARAKATLEYLVKKGISKERLTAMGMGEKQPKASNNTPAGRQRNRRIEFKLK
jgi:outer membrane protein OmpA-like peptidoglycan-associated protein